MDPGSVEVIQWLAEAGSSAVLIVAIWFFVTGRVATRERLAEIRADCERERQEDRAEIARLQAKLETNEQETRMMAQAALDALKRAAMGAT